jgi:hypothetical protein
MNADDVPPLFVALCRAQKIFGPVRMIAGLCTAHHGGDFCAKIVDVRLPPETALRRRVGAPRWTGVPPFQTRSMARNLSDDIRVRTGLRLAAG